MLSNIYTHSYVFLHCSVQSCGGRLDCAQHSISILTYEVCVHPRVSILAFLFIKSLSNKSNEFPRKPGDHSRWNCSYCWCCGDGYQFSTESQSGNSCTANSRSQLCCWPQASKRICEVNFVAAFTV
jgi:hypothetical protein